MAGVPGLMRLGLTVPAESKKHPGFDYKVDTHNNLIAFEKTGGSTSVSASISGDASPSKGAFSRRPQVEPFVPPKFALAGQRLTFKGFFQEAVPESRTEASRQRHLILQYFLEDDSLAIMEPGNRNDGLMHGPFLKRMKIPDVTVEKLRVGEVIEIFSKAIHVYACDEFTRKFYDGLGHSQPADESPIPDEYSRTFSLAAQRNDPELYHGVKSSAISRFVEIAQGSTRGQGFKKDLKGRFLQFDGVVLRFHIMWHDTYADPPCRYFFWLSYYLASEEVEIKEVKGSKNTIGVPTLLKKQRLPKTTIITDDRMRSVEDGTGDEDYYHEDDFLVGSKIRVFGREMLILDVDAATQKWYKENKGIDQQASRIVVEEPAPAVHPVIIPPHIGIGSEEDTLASFRSLIPKKPKIDLNKFRSRTGKTVKYMARLQTADPINSERVFRITFYHDDDELAVFEPPVRNSGLSAGVFMKKKKVKNVATGEWFKAADLAVGKEVIIKAHRLFIFEEEAQPAVKIPDVAEVVLALKKKLLDASGSLRKMFRKFDLDKSQTMSFDEFFNMLNYYSLGLSKYEAIVLFKAFEDKPGFMSYENFMVAFDQAKDGVASSTSDGGEGVIEAAARLKSASSLEDLDAMIEQARDRAKREERKQATEVLLAKIARSMRNTRGSSDMHANFRRFDVNKDHMISPAEFRAVMGSGGLFLTKEEVEMLVDKFYHDEEGNESGDLDYTSFMHTLHVYADKVIRS